EIDFLSKTRTDIPARITGQRPTDRQLAFAVVMYVLFSHVRVVPHHFFLESARRGVVLDLDDLGSHDAFEPVHDDAGPKAFERTRPLRPVAHTHRIVVPVRIPKSQEQSSRRLEPQGV